MVKINSLSVKNIFILSIIIILVSACSQIDKYKELRDLENGGAFLIHLSNLYEKLSKAQAAKADWADSSLFSEKSLRTAKGILIDPEHPEDWNVRNSVLGELKSARRILLDNVNGEAIKQKPRISANAYFMYDCWIEQEENWWLRYIDTCKKEFYNTINMLQSVVKDVSQKAERLSIEDIENKDSINIISKNIKTDNEKTDIIDLAPKDLHLQDNKLSKIDLNNKPSDKTITEEDIVNEVMLEIPIVNNNEDSTKNIKKSNSLTNNKFILYFSLDSHEISGETMLKLQDIVHKIAEVKPKLITINGHTDRSGKKSYNLDLSKKRANTVYKSLLEYGEMGIEKNEFEILGFGESYPARKTEDGIKDPANRRVEIILE